MIERGLTEAGYVRRLWVGVCALVVAGALVLVGWWAGRSALEPPADPLAEPARVSVAVVEGSVGRSLPLSASAVWVSVGVVRSPVDGVVTSVEVDPAVALVEGARLASVNLVPVVVMSGSVPVFRDLGVGARGADVEQLEAFLSRLGFDPGLLDGSFSTATARAVRAWQTAVGAPVTGVVGLGSVVAVPTLLARVRAVVEVGVSVAAGEPLLELIAEAPVFTMGLTDEQVTLIPPGAVVRVSGAGVAWSATAGLVGRSEEGNPLLTLDGVDGAPVCGGECGLVPLVGESGWSAEVVVVAEVSGLVVPVGAVSTRPAGSRFVVTEDGREVEVVVLGSSDGQAVVEGVELGTRVLLPVSPP